MKKRLLIALLGTGLGVLLFSASLGLNRGATTPSAEAVADSIVVSGQQCMSASQVSVSFSWNAYNEGQEWFDLSLSNNGFAPGTFVGIGPLASGQTAFTWAGILPGLTHYLRINTLTPYGWSTSQTMAFTTVDCQYAQSQIAVVTPNQTTFSYPVNGQCPAGTYWQDGLCYGALSFDQSFACQGGSFAYNGTCYYPTGVAAANGQCAAAGLIQNGMCYVPGTPGYFPQTAATCYRGYNQMGQCYDSLPMP